MLPSDLARETASGTTGRCDEHVRVGSPPRSGASWWMAGWMWAFTCAAR